jgi:hypothetical protein
MASASSSGPEGGAAGGEGYSGVLLAPRAVWRPVASSTGSPHAFVVQVHDVRADLIQVVMQGGHFQTVGE